MAEMVPESIATTDATSGEKRVFRILRDALLPDEEHIVWFEPKVAKRRPDFLLWSYDLGLLILEVKDWTLAQIRETNTDRWIVRMQGVDAIHENPVEQARKAFIHFKDLLQSSSSLRHHDGPHQGQLLFPIGFCAVFTQITRKQATENGILSVLGAAECLFSDDLIFDIDSAEARRLFLAKLRKAFVVRFPATPLDGVQLKVLRTLIFPEVRIRGSRSLRTTEQEQLIAALDLEQERTAKSLTAGHHVLKGVAGSGKTVVLTCRAQYLHRLEPTWRILIVCFNRSLCSSIEKMLTTPAGSHDIEVFHYHALVKSLTGTSVGKLDDESSEAWDSRIGTILSNAITGGSLTQRYDAILIDEGQDFAIEWLQSLTQLLNPATDSLLFCLDPAQNIFGRKVSYKSLGIKVQGKRPVTLKKTYRNTSEILALARHFSGVTEEEDTAAEADPDQYRMESLLFPVDVDRHGSKPEIVDGISHAGQITFILNTIARLIEDGICQWCDIGVLYAARYDNFATRFRDALLKQHPKDKLYWVNESSIHKRSLDLSTPSIKLSTIESAKGMEFRVVFLIGLEMLPRSDRDKESERKLAYVGLTRAQDLLYILGEARTGLFAELIEIAETAQPEVR